MPRPDAMLRAINLHEALARIDDCWNPRVLCELNGQHIRLVRIHGEFAWHAHENEDECFLVLEGSFRLQFRDPHGVLVNRAVGQGELIVVPRGVQHRPVADEPCSILLFEPAGTRNTGNVSCPFTRQELDDA